MMLRLSQAVRLGQYVFPACITNDTTGEGRDISHLIMKSLFADCNPLCLNHESHFSLPPGPGLPWSWVRSRGGWKQSENEVDKKYVSGKAAKKPHVTFMAFVHSP